ncbi:MAG: ATP phosphoribosyltransferase, partial [Alphaproteobacteria bacterium]|nr:ATP phosphoribosyltransferase [Alphaproteobacteria bacterium]
MSANANDRLVLALPKGRILTEVMPLVRHAGIEPEAAFEDEHSRQLTFATNRPEVSIIRVRSFDV